MFKIRPLGAEPGNRYTLRHFDVRLLADLAHRIHVTTAALYTTAAVQSKMVTVPGAFLLLPTDACLCLGDVKYHRSTLILPGSCFAVRQCIGGWQSRQTYICAVIMTRRVIKLSRISLSQLRVRAIDWLILLIPLISFASCMSTLLNLSLIHI